MCRTFIGGGVPFGSILEERRRRKQDWAKGGVEV